MYIIISFYMVSIQNFCSLYLKGEKKVGSEKKNVKKIMDKWNAWQHSVIYSPATYNRTHKEDKRTQNFSLHVFMFS